VINGIPFPIHAPSMRHASPSGIILKFCLMQPIRESEFSRLSVRTLALYDFRPKGNSTVLCSLNFAVDAAHHNRKISHRILLAIAQHSNPRKSVSIRCHVLRYYVICVTIQSTACGITAYFLSGRLNAQYILCLSAHLCYYAPSFRICCLREYYGGP
jgi:hypothetical protein